jgi:hypothetical protein
MLPVLSLGPWLLWNVRVYGWGVWQTHWQGHFDPEGLGNSPWLLAGMGLCGVVLGVVGGRMSRSDGGNVAALNRALTTDRGDQKVTIDAFIRTPGFWMMVIVLLATGPAWITALQPFHIPETSWRMGAFAGHGVWFYARRLIEFSPLYGLGLLPWIRWGQHGDIRQQYLATTLLILFAFFIAWGNYQSRYILPSAPILLILAVSSLAKLHSRPSRLPRWLIPTLLIWIALRSLIMNVELVWGNDYCYF